MKYLSNWIRNDCYSVRGARLRRVGIGDINHPEDCREGRADNNTSVADRLLSA